MESRKAEADKLTTFMDIRQEDRKQLLQVPENGLDI